jgi:hypothetical protein
MGIDFFRESEEIYDRLCAMGRIFFEKLSKLRNLYQWTYCRRWGGKDQRVILHPSESCMWQAV